MKLGIMQPYFFPYLGYFSLIANTDCWIVFDKVQFIRHGWIERNRILKPGLGWQYISVPLVKHSRDTTIQNIKIRQDDDWQDKILRQLLHYKKNAPYYSSTIDLVAEALSERTDSIVTLNARALELVCNYLEIDFKWHVLSQMELNIEEPRQAGDWALNIAAAMNAEMYMNPIDGAELFEADKFEKAGIKLAFMENNLSVYSQGRQSFEPALSIIDVLMFNDPTAVRSMIDNSKVTI